MVTASGTDLTLSGEDQQRFFGESGKGANQRFDTALILELIQAAEGRDDALLDLAFLFSIFDDLQVLILAGLFNASEHGGAS